MLELEALLNFRSLQLSPTQGRIEAEPSPRDSGLDRSRPKRGNVTSLFPPRNWIFQLLHCCAAQGKTVWHSLAFFKTSLIDVVCFQSQIFFQKIWFSIFCNWCFIWRSCGEMLAVYSKFMYMYLFFRILAYKRVHKSFPATFSFIIFLWHLKFSNQLVRKISNIWNLSTIAFKMKVCLKVCLILQYHMMWWFPNCCTWALLGLRTIFSKF